MELKTLTGKQVIQTRKVFSDGKFGKVYQQSTSPDYAGQSGTTATAAAAAICASSKSSA